MVKRYNSYGIGYHLLAWIAYAFVIGLGADELDKDFVLKQIAYHLPVIIVFYTSIGVLFPRFLKSKSYVKLTVTLLLLCSLTVFIRVLLYVQFKRYLPLLDTYDSILFWNQFRANILFVGIAFGYWFFKKNIQNEKDFQKLQRDMARARLAQLKNQINPHFLYNTLSFLYSKSLPLSDSLAAAIGKLSDMMRYSLDEAGYNGLVPLENEIKHLRDYIEIHQLRFDNSLQVELHTNGDTGDYQIAPLVLITFVENTFKHGDLTDPSNPARISVLTNRDGIVFRAENKVANGSQLTSNGIGLENIQNRLKYLYRDRFELKIDRTGNRHRVYLKLSKQ